MSKKISKEEWHRRYKQCIMDNSRCNEAEAQACLVAGMGEYDYAEQPEEMAMSEMSYWDEGWAKEER